MQTGWRWRDSKAFAFLIHFFASFAIPATALNQSNSELQVLCGCTPNALRLSIHAWNAFNGDSRVVGGCHPHSPNSEATLGLDADGKFRLHPDSNVKDMSKLIHPFYVKELVRLIRNTSSVEGPLSFSVFTNDNGSPPPSHSSMHLLYCLHSSYPAHGCVINIMLPTYASRQGIRHSMSLLSNPDLTNGKPYSSRKNVAFWRGSDSGGGYRRRFVSSLRGVPNVSADLSKVPLSLFKEHKILLAIDGNSFSSLFKGALLTGSVVIRVRPHLYQNHAHQEWFEPMLRQMHHYIVSDDLPVSINSSVQWALHHPVEAETIGRNGRSFAMEFLQPGFINCYSCTTLNLAVRHQQQTSSCKGATLLSLGWEELPY